MDVTLFWSGFNSETKWSLLRLQKDSVDVHSFFFSCVCTVGLRSGDVLVDVIGYTFISSPCPLRQHRPITEKSIRYSCNCFFGLSSVWCRTRRCVRGIHDRWFMSHTIDNRQAPCYYDHGDFSETLFAQFKMLQVGRRWSGLTKCRHRKTSGIQGYTTWYASVLPSTWRWICTCLVCQHGLRLIREFHFTDVVVHEINHVSKNTTTY